MAEEQQEVEKYRDVELEAALGHLLNIASAKTGKALGIGLYKVQVKVTYKIPDGRVFIDSRGTVPKKRKARS